MQREYTKVLDCDVSVVCCTHGYKLLTECDFLQGKLVGEVAKRSVSKNSDSGKASGASKKLRKVPVGPSAEPDYTPVAERKTFLEERPAALPPKHSPRFDPSLGNRSLRAPCERGQADGQRKGPAPMPEEAKASLARAAAASKSASLAVTRERPLKAPRKVQQPARPKRGPKLPHAAPISGTPSPIAPVSTEPRPASVAAAKDTETAATQVRASNFCILEVERAKLEAPHLGRAVTPMEGPGCDTGCALRGLNESLGSGFLAFWVPVQALLVVYTKAFKNEFPWDHLRWRRWLESIFVEVTGEYRPAPPR